MYNPNYCDKAIPLVSVNESGKYQMTQDAIKFMKSVPAPLGIVSVAGLYRTGKSYLLNRMLLNTNKPKQGFGVGPTINPCTKGLWCWGTPIKGKSQNGQSINIIVIDTQGIGALDEDQTHDTRIFTLAILASSCFIYNSVGSIDQTAVQNLSLVVNLTKNIQLKSSNKSYDDEQNADQMAHYFPTFYWVVRDFSLQLQDPQGNTITSKEYLEKALSPLKSSSQFDEDVEQKNKIRKLLTSFFKDRDCFTMVRPLVDETKLQDLDAIPFEQLRPDFIEQVIQFRKRVTQGLKIKTVNGKQLNGDMYCNMMCSYVNAINDGAVPNIENAWNYMCQQQCQKIQQDCENIFDKELRDNMKFPVEEQYFDATCQNAFEICMMNYRQKAIGDSSLSLKYEKQLKERIKQKIKNSREQNIKASKQFLQKKVLQVFNPIIEQLKKQHFKTFEQFQKTINSSYENLVANSPNLPFTRQKYLQLYKKVQRQGADYIFKCLNKQIQNMKSIFKEKQEYYVKQLDNIKLDQDNDRKNYSMKISDMDKQKFETQSKIQRLEFELDKLIKQKQSETDKLSKNLTFKQSEFETYRKNLQFKLQQTETKFQEISKNFAKQLKVWQKDRTLMQSKIKQQSSTIQQMQKQRQIAKARHDEEGNLYNLTIKQQKNKIDKKIGQMQNEIKKLKQTKFELTENLKSMKDQLDERNDKYQRTQKKLKEQLNSKKRQFQTLKNQVEMQKKKLQQQLQDERDINTKTKSTFNDDVKKQKDLISQLTQQLRKVRVESQNKQAQFEQKMRYIEQEKSFLKQQMQQNKRSHMRQIQDYKSQNHQVIEQKQKIIIQSTKTHYITQIKNITTQFDNERKKYTYQAEILKNSNKDMDLELKVLKQQLFDQKNNFKQFENQSNEKIQFLQQQLKNLERAKQSTLMQKQTLLKKKIFDLESQIEYIKQKNDSQQRQTQQKNKQCIIQLRVTYERQRQDMQNNYLRQKQRGQKKYDEMVQEYETKHRQQIQNLQQQLQHFRQQANAIEDELRAAVKDLQYTADSQQKDIINLRNMLQQLKLTLNKKQQQYTKKYDNLSMTYKQQKQQLIIKLQLLQQQFNQLQKDLMNINHQKQRLSNQYQKIKTTLKDTQDQYSVKKQQYITIIQQLKRKLSEKQNQFMELKINYQKQTALLSQENTHINQKNIQLTNQLKRIDQIHQDKIKKIKSQSQQTITSTIEKYSSQRNSIQQKYDKLKKASKDNQSTLNKKLNQMQKQKAVDFQKINNLEIKIAALDEKRRNQYSNLQRQHQKLKEMYRNDKNNFTNDINKLKQQLDQVSRKKIQIETKYQKETLLLRNQVQNEINLRKTKQTQFAQTINQYQYQIENLQKSKNSEFSKYQSNQNQQRIKIEQSYRSKITQNSRVIEKWNRDYEQLMRKYDSVTKDLKQSLAIQRQAKETTIVKLDKKTNQWQEQEKRFQQELDVLKAEREQKGLQYQKELEKQKLTLKLRLNDLENKHKATDKEKINLFMELQREKAKFSQINSNLTQEVEHLKDKIAKLQKDKTKLDKDNERLKVEKRTAKNASYIRTGGLEERKSTITIRKMQKKQNSEYKQEEEYNKQNNNIMQQTLLDD